MKDRLEYINDYIQQKGEIKISDLEALKLDVSEMTIRRDLDLLEQKGKIIRIRGGARSIASLSKCLIREERFSSRILENPEGKEIISQKALALLEHEQSIYLDAGTTCTSFARELPDNNISAMTNAPNIAVLLADRKHISVTCVGGQLAKENFSISGVGSLEFVKNINIDLAFIAASGFSLKNGFTTSNANECELKRTIIRKARQVAVLMDHTKINRVMTFTFAELKDIDILVTDKELSEAILHAAKRANVKVL